MYAEDVLETVRRDRAFYDATKGGMTVSGGEPLFQPRFTAEILRLCKEERIHTALETCGYASETVFSEVLRYCDTVLFDIKETDEEKHIAYTGVSLKPILRNLKILNEKGIPFVIRAPIIPTLNDREEHFENLSCLRKKFENCERIQIMPYHDFGSYKYEKLGRKYLCEDILRPKAEFCEEWKRKISDLEKR
jgi:pyruvate formate lyase activating enzyme